MNVLFVCFHTKPNAHDAAKKYPQGFLQFSQQSFEIWSDIYRHT